MQFPQNSPIVLIAAITLSVGYIITLITLAALVLILHDGEATQTVVSSLTTMTFTGLGALTTIILGHSFISSLATKIPPPSVTGERHDSVP